MRSTVLIFGRSGFTLWIIIQDQSDFVQKHVDEKRVWPPVVVCWLVVLEHNGPIGASKRSSQPHSCWFHIQNPSVLETLLSTLWPLNRMIRWTRETDKSFRWDTSSCVWVVLRKVKMLWAVLRFSPTKTTTVLGQSGMRIPRTPSPPEGISKSVQLGVPLWLLTPTVLIRHTP